MPSRPRTPTRRRALTWPATIEQYEEHLLARRASPRTVDSYTRELRYFADYAGDGGPSAVTLGDLRAYQAGLMTGETTRRGRPLGAGTVGRVTTTLASFFGYLHVEALIPEDPTVRLERPKKAQPVGDVLSLPEVKKILAAPDHTTPIGLRDLALMETLYGTGLRRAELLALDLSDVRRDDRELLVRHGKGDKARVVPVGRTTWAALMAYMERGRPTLVGRRAGAEPAVFVSQRGQRLHPGRLREILIDLAHAAGITRQVSPHTWRRTYATHLILNGASLRHVQLLLGHESLETTARYLRLSSVQVRREVLLKHPRERFQV